MENKGKITTVVMTTKWYEIKPLIAHRTIKKLEKWIASNLKAKRVKLKTDTLITECETCGTLQLTVHWEIVSSRASHKLHYGKSQECNYCWTRKQI